MKGGGCDQIEERVMKKLILVVITCAALAAAYWGYSTTRPPFFETDTPLVAEEGPVDLLADLDPKNLGPGWRERSFFRVTPANYTLSEQDGTAVLRCTTDNSASILARDTDIALDDLSILSWSWQVTQPIESDIDEATEAGDDHPLRFYMRFSNEQGETRGMEIIYSNRKYAPGEYKIIGTFYHYVADGLAENVGTWRDHSVDLRQIYTDIGGTGTPRIETLGFFCDSDNTGAKSDGMFRNVILSADTEQK